MIRGWGPKRAVILVATLWLAIVSSHGCASPTVERKACLGFEVTDTLNLYDGEPHPLTLFIYPLSSTEGFEATAADDLLAGARPAGVIAPPVPITVEPGEAKRTFQELFPAETHHLGVIADYFRAPGEEEGVRRVVVPARCGILKPKVVLESRNLEVD